MCCSSNLLQLIYRSQGGTTGAVIRKVSGCNASQMVNEFWEAALSEVKEKNIGLSLRMQRSGVKQSYREDAREAPSPRSLRLHLTMTTELMWLR